MVVTVSVLSLLSGGSGALASLRSLRTLRVLRPLRMISRNEGLKLVVNALLKALPGIVNVIVVTVLVFLIFSVVTVNYFKGGLNSCQGANFTGLLSSDQINLVTNPISFSQLSVVEPYASLNASTWGNDPAGYADVTSKAVCLWLNCAWGRVTSQSFDNVGWAFVSLFQSTTVSSFLVCRMWFARVAVTRGALARVRGALGGRNTCSIGGSQFEGWNDMMWAAVDSNGVDMQPIENNTPGRCNS